VALAIDLARHAANGRNDPALPDDFQAIQNLLHINRETLLHKLHLFREDSPLAHPLPDSLTLGPLEGEAGSL